MNNAYFVRKFEACFVDVKGFSNSHTARLVNESVTQNTANQKQTTDVFSEKWEKYDQNEEKDVLFNFQKQWYLTLYGFKTEDALRTFLANKAVILDAGCGLGYKAAWFAELAPHAVVIGMDLSDAVELSAERYADIDNLFFIRGDIAKTGLRDGAIDYCNCDQVIMHTDNAENTFKELARVTNQDGELACYFYAQKALPRELLDDYFRSHCKKMSTQALWEMSNQLTELGKRLSNLNVSFEAPEIPELGIKGGIYDIQRFVYWNFLKCFWNAELGQETSVSTNFDWYSPSNARRFTKEDVESIVATNLMSIQFFHTEESGHSGRFSHN